MVEKVAVIGARDSMPMITAVGMAWATTKVGND